VKAPIAISEPESRPLPASLECEQLVLGSVQLDGANWDAISDLDSADFSLEKHRRIFAAMQAIALNGGTIDRITLAHELRNRGQLESVDGFSYLVSMDDHLPKIYNLGAYVRILREKSHLRRIIFASQELLEAAMSDSGTLGTVQERIDALGSVSVAGIGHPWQTAGEILAEAGGADAFFAAQSGIPTPWEPLAKIFPVLTYGSVTVVAARPGMGKSALAGILGQRAAAAGVPVAIWPLEMRGEEYIKRLLADLADVNHARLRAGNVSQAERRALMRSISDLDAMPLWISTTKGVTIRKVEAEYNRAALAGKRPEMLIIDYLKLMRGPGKTTIEKLDTIMQELKQLAGKLGVAIVIMAQLSREHVKEDREPQFADIKDCGGIEENADNVLMLFCRSATLAECRKNKLPVPLTVFLRKQRGGVTGQCEIEFDGRYMRMTEPGQPEQLAQLSL
jgi:replicative DNA helicase